MEKNKFFGKVFIGLGGILIFTGSYLKINGSSNMYTIRFLTDGGALIDLQEVKNGGSVKKPDDPVKENAIFIEWQYNNKAYNFNAPVKKDMTLTAKWGEVELTDENSILITFIDVDEKKIGEKRIKFNEKITEPEVPTKKGYEFMYWELDGEKYLFGEKAVKGKNIKLKAKWKEVDNSVSVNFDTDGGNNIEVQKVALGDKITRPKDPTKKGYKFIEWQLDGKTYDFNSTIEKNVTLKAKWQALASYTIKFNTDGGSSVETQKVYENEKIQKPVNPTKNGYEFVQWKVDGKAYDFNSIVNSNLELKAEWKKVNTYTVKFTTDGGTAISDQIVQEGKTVTKPNNPTKSGYEFVKWTLDNNEYNFNTKVNKNITLVAVWKLVEKPIENYTVVFDSKGGTPISNVTVKMGEKVERPTDPVKEGYIFVGWTLNDTAYDFNSPVNKNITLIANWVQKSYVIELETVEGVTGVEYKAKVLENGNQIEFEKIQETDGTTICTSSNPIVQLDKIVSNKEYKVTLKDGTTVTAKLSEK